MIRPTPTCRRNHALTGANVRKQTNKHTRTNGKVVKYKTRICVACAKYRYERKVKGLKVKDQRKGRR